MTKDIRPLIPVSINGLDELVKELLNESAPVNQPTITKTNINKSEYIIIPNTKIIISREELYKNKNWKDSHYTLQDNGLYMPTPAIFIDYFLKVKQAQEGKISLSYADGNPLKKKEVEDLWKYLTTNFDKGCWTWLDSLFKEENNKWYIEYGHKVVDPKGNKELKTSKKENLEQCIMEDCFVDLDFNKQGLPKQKHSSQEYKQGENIHFYHPRENTVAGFDADSNGAGLYCVRDPYYSNSELGVFACAENTGE